MANPVRSACGSTMVILTKIMGSIIYPPSYESQTAAVAAKWADREFSLAADVLLHVATKTTTK